MVTHDTEPEASGIAVDSSAVTSASGTAHTNKRTKPGRHHNNKNNQKGDNIFGNGSGNGILAGTINMIKTM